MADKISPGGSILAGDQNFCYRPALRYYALARKCQKRLRFHFGTTLSAKMASDSTVLFTAKVVAFTITEDQSTTDQECSRVIVQRRENGEHQIIVFNHTTDREVMNVLYTILYNSRRRYTFGSPIYNVD